MGKRAGRHLYLVALGSNVRHTRHGAPRRVLAAALDAIEGRATRVLAVARTIETAPVGPSRRRYANSAAIVASEREPMRMLRRLQKIERRFGRRRRGADWAARVLDLDLVLWDGGALALDEGGTSLVLPHPLFRRRAFVLTPAATIAGDWRDPLSGLTVRQLRARALRPRPLAGGTWPSHKRP